MRETRFAIDFENDPDGLYYSVNNGEPRGPFATDLDRVADLMQALGRLAAEAREAGGELVQVGETAWRLELPDDVDSRWAA